MFTKANLNHFTLDLLCQFETHYTLVDSNQNSCMYFVLAIKLSEVWIRILINDIVFISNEYLMNGEYGLSSRKEKRALFLYSCV